MKIANALSMMILTLALGGVAHAQDYHDDGSGASGGSSSYSASSSGSSGGMRLALQARVPFRSIVNIPEAAGASPIVPALAAGVYLGPLFIGVGLDYSSDDADGNQGSFALAPTVNYELLDAGVSKLYLLGAFGIGHVFDNADDTTDESYTRWGLSLGAGIKAQPVEGLAVGTELGWGLAGLSFGNDAADGVMGHSFFGTIFVEGSIGL